MGKMISNSNDVLPLVSLPIFSGVFSTWNNFRLLMKQDTVRLHRLVVFKGWEGQDTHAFRHQHSL